MSPAAIEHRPALLALSLCVLLGSALAGPATAASDDTPQVTRAPADRAAPGAAVPKPGTKPVLEVAPEAFTCTGQRFIGQRIACYSDRAVQAGDPRVCLDAGSPDVRWPCVAKYAVVAGSSATCRLLPGPSGPADAAAVSDTDSEGDGEDSGADARAGETAAQNGARSVSVDLCLSTLALVYRRADLCRDLTTETMDDACLAKLVAGGGDPALCREIKSEQLRDVCGPDPRAEVAE